MKERKIITLKAWVEYDDDTDTYTVHHTDRYGRTAVISDQKFVMHVGKGIVMTRDITPKRFKWKWRAKMLRDKKAYELFKECCNSYWGIR